MPRTFLLFLFAVSAFAQSSVDLSELKARRRAVMEKIGPDGAMILYAAEGRIYAADVDYPYRQENNFLYLTGLQEEGAVLVLLPGGTEAKELLFLPTKARNAEVFTGSVIKPADVTRISGIEKVLPMSDLSALFSTLAPLMNIGQPAVRGGGRQQNAATRSDEWKKTYKTFADAVTDERAQLFLLLPRAAHSIEFRREQELAASIASVASGVTVRDATPIFRQMRLIKSPAEISAIERAISISAEGFDRAFALTAPGVAEADIQAEFDRAYARHHARWGYPTIAASGVNGTTLHYNSNGSEMPAQGTMVLDAGAEYAQYSADVTRTFPITGKFTPEQAELYRIVYDAQQAGIAAAKPGVEVGTSLRFGKDSVQGAAVAVIRRGLLKVGLITSVENDEYKNWLPHGVSHQLGMNVHDLAGRDQKLAAGMVITMEPGIYVRPDALESLAKTPENEKFIAAVRPAFEKYKGIGIRIEDDILITDGPAKVLSAAIPSKLGDVEATMARLHGKQ